MKFSLFLILFLFILLNSGPVFAAHFVIGRVNDALDGTSANDRQIILWNPTVGINDNLTDTIGVNGNSNQPNLYMIDCELLSQPCDIGDNISVAIVDLGDWHNSNPVNISITGAGFDLAENITLNSPPSLSMTDFDDSLSIPSGEIDLLAATTKVVFCSGVVEDLDGDNLVAAAAEIFHTSSFYGDSDDNNFHYTNSSCDIDNSYGNENQSFVNCSFELWYYSAEGSWSCFLDSSDVFGNYGNSTSSSYVNGLLSVGMQDNLDYGLINATYVSGEKILNVTNYGNVRINLSLSGYGGSEGDGHAMNCSLGNTYIPVGYEGYNLSESVPGILSLSEFENFYLNLSSSPVTRYFGLDFRHDDISAGNDDTNSTYWRIYVPASVGGTCSGSIVVGATQAPGA